ncbi:hypothetical protein AnigIFM63309_011195 [Aspergillus niger]|nr:hypothetical protein AnigIFM63309_011195 [Aspergillus niger]
MGGFLSVQSKEKRRRTNRLSKPPPNRATLASNSFRASRQTSGTSSPTECPACTAWQDPWTGTSISLKAPEPDLSGNNSPKSTTAIDGTATATKTGVLCAYTTSESAEVDSQGFSIIRRRSLLTRPGIATRRPARDTARRLSSPVVREPTPSLNYLNETSASPRLLPSGYEDDACGLPSPVTRFRPATPNEFEYTHLGALKLGSLRVVNGSASPCPSDRTRLNRPNSPDPEPSSINTHDTKSEQPQHSSHKVPCYMDQKAQLASESADEQSHNAEIVRDSGHEVDLTSFDLSNIQDYASESAIEQSRKAEIVRDSALDKVDLTSFDLSNIQDYAPVPLEWEIPTIILQAHFPSRDLQQPQLRTDFKVAKQKMKVFLSLMKENGLSTSLNVPSENTGIENSNMRTERLTAATVPQPPSVPLDDRLILAHLHINLEWPADLHSTVIQRTTGFWMPETAQNLALSPLYTVIQAFRVLGQGPKSTAMAGRPTDGQCVMTSDRCPLNRA